MENSEVFTKEQIKEMQDFVNTYFKADDSKLENASKKDKAKYKEYVEVLSSIDNVDGLRAKAYGCYGGNSVFSCDWKASEACLLKLIELDNDHWAANTLGYIYYYGRTTNNVPDYEKAFKYFSVAALYGIHEAIYKLADLCLKGKGVPMRCLRGAENIINWLYYKEIGPNFRNGDIGSKFADVALRKGSIELTKAKENGWSSDYAYGFFLEAEYALKLRASLNYYGDTSILASLRRSIEEVKPLLSFKGCTKIEKERLAVGKALDIFCSAPNCKIKVKRKAKSIIVNCKLRPSISDAKSDLLLVLPEIDYCRFVDSIKIEIKDIIKIKKNAFNGKIDAVYFEDGYLKFLLGDGRLALAVKANRYEIKRKHKKNSGKYYQLVSVEFTENGRQYDYIYDLKEAVSVGERVVVNGYDGETVVTVKKVSSVPANELTLPIERYKKVISKELVNQNDS